MRYRDGSDEAGYCSGHSFFASCGTACPCTARQGKGSLATKPASQPIALVPVLLPSRWQRLASSSSATWPKARDGANVRIARSRDCQRFLRRPRRAIFFPRKPVLLGRRVLSFFARLGRLRFQRVARALFSAEVYPPSILSPYFALPCTILTRLCASAWLP